MSPFRTASRTAVVLAAALALAGLPAGPGAYAATGTVTQASPAFVANTGSATRIAFTLSGEPMSPGEVLDVELSGPAGTTITETGDPDVSGSTVSAVFDLRGKAPGLYAVRVADVSGAVDEYECASCVRLLATPPTVSGVAPDRRGASSPGAPFTVTGTNLFNGVAVRFLRDGAPDTAIAYPSTGALTVAADQRSVTGALAITTSAVAGPRDVEVTNTDGQRAVCAGCLTVTPAPSFTSLTPAVAGQGAVARSMTLLGDAFHPSMTAAFFAPASTTDNGGVTVTSFAVTEGGVATITANVANTSDTANTTRDLVLTNPDGGTTRIADALTVTPEPTVTSLAPSTLDGGAAGERLVVTGAGLAAHPGFSFSGTGVTVNGYEPDAATAATKGVLDVDVAPGATVAGRTLTVVNPDGGRSTSGTVLTVGATPTVTGVSPPSLGRGAAGRAVTITGSNFDNGNGGGNVAVTIPGVTLSSVVATSATTITATAAVPGTADVGLRDVSVLNTAAGRRGRATCAGCFAVDTFSVDSVTPTAVLNSATYELEVTGSQLPAGKTITATLSRTVARAGQGPIAFDGVVNGDGTRFTGTVDLRDMAPGAYTLRLADGDATGTCSCSFGIVAEHSPALTSASPSTLPQGASGQVLTLRGSGFTRGTGVRFGDGVTAAGAVEFVDAATLRVPVDVAGNANAAAVPVTVLVPSFGADTEATCGACFAVTRRPVVSSASRPARGQGASAAVVTLTGTDFQPGATVSAGDGVAVSDVVRVSPTAITFTATVAADAVPGPRVITVTNPDSGAGACACFAVTPRPLATAVSPVTGGQGRDNVPVTLTGTGFQSGAWLSFGDDIGVSNVTGSGDSLSATLDLTNARTGAHEITVVNQDGGAAGCDCSYTVHVVPAITSLTPASAGAGAVRRAIAVLGANFTPAATVAFADPGITVVGSAVVDATRIDAIVSVAGDVAPGTRGVTVTNLDTGQAGDCAACFTVNPKPTLAPAEHRAQRNRDGVTVTFSGTGFQPGAVGAELGDGITVREAQTVTATSVTVTFDVSPAASLGARDITLVNGDGGRATCAGCLVVTTPRVFTISGDASPVSGAARQVTVTAHVSSDEASATDTSYTGVPVLSAAGDGHFDSGSCAAAVAGVSRCDGVVFGDLGAAQLNASGAGADGDLGGTRAVVVEPVSLAFSPAPPRTARTGSPVTFTVRPVAGVADASIADYAAARTAHVTGHSVGAVPLQCGSAVCSFSLTFTSTGSKTVRVSDDSSPSASTPTATVTVPIATSIADWRISRVKIVAGQSVTVSGALRDSSGRALPGQRIGIYVAGYGLSRWTGIARVTTDANGRFAKSLGFTRTRSIRAVFLPVNSTYATSATRVIGVGVATKVSVTSPASGSRVAAGRTFVVRGGTYPAKPGVKAYLYWRRSDGRYVLLSSATIGSDGRYAISRSLGRGTYTLNVRVPAAAGNITGWSPFFTLRVV